MSKCLTTSNEMQSYCEMWIIRKIRKFPYFIMWYNVQAGNTFSVTLTQLWESPDRPGKWLSRKKNWCQTFWEASRRLPRKLLQRMTYGRSLNMSIRSMKTSHHSLHRTGPQTRGAGTKLKSGPSQDNKSVLNVFLTFAYLLFQTFKNYFYFCTIF